MRLLIADNIKYMTNVAQNAYRDFCVINELCRKACVPVYPDDEMIGLKAPLNASTIRRLQNTHQGEAVQNEQQENQ